MDLHRAIDAPAGHSTNAIAEACSLRGPSKARHDTVREVPMNRAQPHRLDAARLQ